MNDRIPAEYWAHLAHDKAAGRAWECLCGESNPGSYDTCHFCQRPHAAEGDQ